MLEKIRKGIEYIYPHIVEIRRKFHKHPELKLQEYKTAELVQKELTRAGWKTHPNYANTTAVIGLFEGKKDGPVRAFRADMDALPIKEDTGLQYSSEVEGVMHACGHDFHTSILLGLAYLLNRERDQLAGRVILVFQPGEEGGFGARILTDAGLIKDFGIEYIIGQHLHTDTHLGTVEYRRGIMSANSDRFRITITGQGGHASRPHEAIDPIAIASHIYISLCTIHSRETSPLNPTVITVASINAGTASNVIPDLAVMKGTVRTLGEENRDFTLKRIKDVAEQIARTFRGTADVKISDGYPSVVNDDTITEKVIEAVSLYLGRKNLVEMKQPSMGGEDFSYYLKKVPGSIYRIGVGPSSSLHCSKFAPNEEALKIGMGINSTIALLLS